MRKFLPGIALFAAVAFASTAASANETRRFTRDGATYSYTVVKQGDHFILKGVCESNGTPFELAVRGDWISGTANGTRVSFRMPGAQAKLDTTTTELALR